MLCYVIYILHFSPHAVTKQTYDERDCWRSTIDVTSWPFSCRPTARA